MFILIENYADEIDSYCRMKGTFESLEDAQSDMTALYLEAKARNTEYELDWDYLEDDEARLNWQGNSDWYDWHIFEV